MVKTKARHGTINAKQSVMDAAPLLMRAFSPAESIVLLTLIDEAFKKGIHSRNTLGILGAKFKQAYKLREQREA